MAVYELMVPFIKQWEGSFSKDPSDLAAKNLPAELNGIHTNTGVTWHTYVQAAPSLLGKEPTPEGFLNMTDQEWGRIMKERYWRPIQGEKIASQIIANAVLDFYWHSGGYAVKKLQESLNRLHGSNLTVDGDLGPVTLKYTNMSNDLVLFNYYIIARLKFFDAIVKSRRSQRKFINGWYNRVYDLVKYSL